VKFWDASAVIPLFVREPRSRLLQAILKEDKHIIVWWGTIIECLSAIARLQREKVIDEKGVTEAREILGLLAGNWSEVEPSPLVRKTAERLLRLHPLRAADSLQLAAALVWTGGNPIDQSFVSLDVRLNKAASLEGFKLFPKSG
jgi:hypothetical protein